MNNFLYKVTWETVSPSLKTVTFMGPAAAAQKPESRKKGLRDINKFVNQARIQPW